MSAVTACCQADLTETGFCTRCKDHADLEYYCDDCETEMTEKEYKEQNGLCYECAWLMGK